MSERLPTLLHDLAGEMPVEMEPSTRRVVRRARARRFTTVLVSATTVLAVVVGGVSALRIASPSEAADPAASGVMPTPSPTGAIRIPSDSFPGLWPATTADQSARLQAEVDDGHQPMYLDPAQTAAMLATNLFGWQPDDVQVRTTVAQDERFVELRNRTFGEDVPPITVDLAQLGRTGPDGIWSVVKVSSPLLDEAWTWVALVNGTDVAVQTNPSDLPDGAALQIEVLNGAVPESGSSAATATPSGGAYGASVSIAGVDLESAVLWVQAVDEHGAALGAMASPLSSLVAPETPAPGETPPPASGETPLPAAVIAAHDAIQLAAVDHDAAALDALVDPSRFAYDFGDARRFTRALREDPSMFDTIAQLLALPFWVNDTEGTNVTYVFPAFMRPGALEHLSDVDRAQLHGLGFSDEQIDQMASSGGYLGPRLGIAEDGTWIYLVTGGD